MSDRGAARKWGYVAGRWHVFGAGSGAASNCYSHASAPAALLDHPDGTLDSICRKCAQPIINSAMRDAGVVDEGDDWRLPHGSFEKKEDHQLRCKECDSPVTGPWLCDDVNCSAYTLGRDEEGNEDRAHLFGW